MLRFFFSYECFYEIWEDLNIASNGRYLDLYGYALLIV